MSVLGSNGLVILAGGQNSRLFPLSTTIYKSFLPIGGLTSAAQHVLRARLFGIKKVVLVTDTHDPLWNSAMPHMGDDRIEVVCQQIRGSLADKVLGVAETHPTWQPLLVCLGDTVGRVDLLALHSAPVAHGTDSAVCLGRYSIPYGVADVEGSLVTGFQEKPNTSYLINLGYMALGPLALEDLKRSGDLAETLARLANWDMLAMSESIEEFRVLDDLNDLVNQHSTWGLTDPTADDEFQLGDTQRARAEGQPASKPLFLAVSLVIREPKSNRVLVVKRPNTPDDDIGGVWGFPATTGDGNQSELALALQVGRMKLGVEIEVGRRLGESTHDRGSFLLRLVDFEAQIRDGAPTVPQPDGLGTQYTDWMFTDDYHLLTPAARKGSQCTQIFLESHGINWQ